jgi:predicted secreted protein
MEQIMELLLAEMKAEMKVQIDSLASKMDAHYERMMTSLEELMAMMKAMEACPGKTEAVWRSRSQLQKRWRP